MNISTSRFKKLLLKHKDQKALFLLDVREIDEFRKGHLPGSVLIPLSDLEQRVLEIPKDRVVVVICRSGKRSLTAANMLKKVGFSKVYNYAGGILDWDGELEY